MNNDKSQFVKTFIDFEQPMIARLSDESAGKTFLERFSPILSSIGRRFKQLPYSSMLYDTPSVAIFDQAKSIFCMGDFFSTIVVCRSTAEYLAYEIFSEEIELEGDPKLIDSIAENLDFRKIVNEFLYNPQKGYQIIDKVSADLFNELYDLGNQWIHPRSTRKKVAIENEAKRAIDMLGKLLSSLRNVLSEYIISKGTLVKKETARSKKRPIKLSGSSLKIIA